MGIEHRHTTFCRSMPTDALSGAQALAAIAAREVFISTTSTMVSFQSQRRTAPSSPSAI